MVNFFDHPASLKSVCSRGFLWTYNGLASSLSGLRRQGGSEFSAGKCIENSKIVWKRFGFSFPILYQGLCNVEKRKRFYVNFYM